MAILGSGDYGTLRRAIYRLGHGKEELKALPALPSETQLLACFQAIENSFESIRPQLKANIDTALGVTTTTALARKIVRAYLEWKLGLGG